MPQDLKIWQIIDGQNLQEFEKSHLDLEKRIEDWIEKGISVVSDDLHA